MVKRNYDLMKLREIDYEIHCGDRKEEVLKKVELYELHDLRSYLRSVRGW